MTMQADARYAIDGGFVFFGTDGGMTLRLKLSPSLLGDSPAKSVDHIITTRRLSSVTTSNVSAERIDLDFHFKETALVSIPLGGDAP